MAILVWLVFGTIWLITKYAMRVFVYTLVAIGLVITLMIDVLVTFARRKRT